MLLNMTPSGNELQRKMLLTHTGKVRNIFNAALLCLVPLGLFIGSYYSKVKKESTGEDSDCLKYVAKIIVDNGGNMSSVGTAFLVTNNAGERSGYLFTARHVVAGTTSEQVYLEFTRITDENDEPLRTTASIKWVTPVAFDGADLQTLRFDVALLRLDDISVLPEDVTGFMINEEVKVKDEISIHGFPKMQEYWTSGCVANESYRDCKDLFIMDMQITQGFSGSPVYKDEEQEVIGITIAEETTNDLMNVALKMSRVKSLLNRDGISLN
ncbi:MAG: serine protease [Bacteroidales bacterium]|nr:serine protease [Bacteroidales bacterium]